MIALSKHRIQFGNQDLLGGRFGVDAKALLFFGQIIQVFKMKPRDRNFKCDIGIWRLSRASRATFLRLI